MTPSVLMTFHIILTIMLITIMTNVYHYDVYHYDVYHCIELFQTLLAGLMYTTGWYT